MLLAVQCSAVLGYVILQKLFWSNQTGHINLRHFIFNWRHTVISGV